MEMLASGQRLEQLYLPGSQENYTLALNSLKSKFCMTRLVPNFSDSTMYTLYERRIWSGTQFTFMWPNLRVESLYPPSIAERRQAAPDLEESGPVMLGISFVSRTVMFF